MTEAEAKKFGKSTAMKAIIILISIWVVSIFITDTINDFANGIIYFFKEFLTLSFLVVITIFVGVTYLLGGTAGKSIIIRNENFIWVAFKSSIIVISVYLVFMALQLIPLFVWRHRLTHSIGDVKNEFVKPIALKSLFLWLFLFITWLCATFKMKLKAKTTV